MVGTERFACVGVVCWQGEGTGAASVEISYLWVDLKDIALCREKRRESCEPLLEESAWRWHKEPKVCVDLLWQHKFGTEIIGGPKLLGSSSDKDSMLTACSLGSVRKYIQKTCIHLFCPNCKILVTKSSLFITKLKNNTLNKYDTCYTKSIA